jgi:pimeloyl-ACP methyl ester carboxylesterase
MIPWAQTGAPGVKELVLLGYRTSCTHHPGETCRSNLILQASRGNGQRWKSSSLVRDGPTESARSQKQGGGVSKPLHAADFVSRHKLKSLTKKNQLRKTRHLAFSLYNYFIPLNVKEGIMSHISGYYWVNGRQIYAELHGVRQPGQPMIVVEVGSTQAGTKDRGWWPVRDAWAKEAQVLFYDRAGLGGSDPVNLPRTIADFTSDLHGLLQAMEIGLPYLLVGGSFGGLIVTHYAALHPQSVAGIVLEDSTHPEHDVRLLTLLPAETPGESQALMNFRDLALKKVYAPLETNEEEGLDFPTSIQQIRSAWDLGDIPLIVLTAGQDSWDEGFPMDVAERYEQFWLDLQKELTARSTNSKNVIVEESEHCIHDKAPARVIEAVRELLRGGCAFGNGAREPENWRTIMKVKPADRKQT